MTVQKFESLEYALDALQLPAALYDKFLVEVNSAVLEYNAAEDGATKIAALDKMHNAILDVDLYNPTISRNRKSGFYKTKVALFAQIKKAYEKEEIFNLFQTVNNNASEIGKIIANMSFDKLESLLCILRDKKPPDVQIALENLYPSLDSAEATNWKKFMLDHRIDFLDGKNSQIFIITNKLDSSVKVLKIADRLGMPRHIEHYLREKLPNLFTSVDVARQVEVRQKGLVVSRTILVTDLCKGISAAAHSQASIALSTAAGNSTTTYADAANIMGQIIEVFMDLQELDCCFSDSNLTNWLVDDNGKLLPIVDDKSFVFTEHGQYHKSVVRNRYVPALLHTEGFVPTEIYGTTHPTFDAEKLHASILGRNIYYYLTGQRPYAMNLTLPIFNGEIGQEYKRLIDALTVDPARNRMSLAQAQIILCKLACKSDPQYQALLDRGKTLRMAHDVDLTLIINEILETKSMRPGFSKPALLSKLQASLDFFSSLTDNQKKHIAPLTKIVMQLDLNHHQVLQDLRNYFARFERINQNCLSLIQQMCDIKINGMSFFNSYELNDLKSVTLSANFIEKICDNLASFAEKVTQDLMDIEAFKQLRKDLNGLSYGYGTTDTEMESYLRRCDFQIETIMQGKNYNQKIQQLNFLKEEMTSIKKGLSKPENEEIRTIIENLRTTKHLWTMGKGEQAGRILSAIQNLPIEERAHLLTSNHPKTHAVWEAIAYHRKPMVSLHMRVDPSIKEKDIADTLAKFKEKFSPPGAQP